jgi:hypothetical protein
MSQVNDTGTASSASSPTPRRMVLCPTCIFDFDWNADPTLYRRDRGQFEALDLPPDLPAPLRRDRERGTWKKCPNKVPGHENDHFLPVAYARDGDPLVICFIGGSNSGKSHLLTAMIGEIADGGLAALGLGHNPIDDEIHRGYMQEKVYSLFERHLLVERTRRADRDEEVELTDAFLVSGDYGTRALAFFDVSGEDLQDASPAMQFVLAADALVFVVDPEKAVRARRRDAESGASLGGDQAFSTVLSRLAAQPAAAEIPVAVAITKCDEYQFELPVMRWMRRRGLAAYQRADDPDRDLIWRETRDAYAFLYQHRAHQWLEPLQRFDQVTMHFVSATGSSLDERTGTYRRGVVPRRVLDPLAAVLAMNGLLGSFAAKIGQ